MAIYKRGKTYHTDVTVSGIRYRESLETTNWQEAQRLQKELIVRASEGKAAAPSGKGSFASLPLEQALTEFVTAREGRVAERTSQIDQERSKALVRHMGKILVRKIDGDTIRSYQTARRAEGVSGTTVNMEVFLVRQVLKRAKRWSVIADDVHNLPENRNVVGKVMTLAEKQKLFRTAATRESWLRAFCAAVISVSTTCRKVEILNLRWSNVDLFARVVQIGRSKTAAGHRTIPLNTDALNAFARLRQRAEAHGGGEPDQYVFPACENEVIDFNRPQKSIRTAWRNITKAAGLKGMRVHDLRHQAITELSEGGASDSTMMSISGHLSRKMLEHYSHVRMAAKRTAIDALGGGLMQSATIPEPATGKPS